MDNTTVHHTAQVTEATMVAMLKASNAELAGVVGSLRKRRAEHGELSAPLAAVLFEAERMLLERPESGRSES